MSKWVWKGLKTGKRTTLYPDVPETAAGVSPGLPGKVPGGMAVEVCRCPTGAIGETAGEARQDVRRCIHCFRCVRTPSGRIDWQEGFEWAAATGPGGNGDRKFGTAFSHSVHIRSVDAGACGACMSELKQMNKPHYNIHRLGFFVTPTPRQADVLLVVGPVPDNMVFPLEKAYEAMPAPKMVIAAGTCALTGSVFGPSFSCGSGVADVIPVDVEIPGCPPPPLAFIHGLLVAVGRKPSASLARNS